MIFLIAGVVLWTVTHLLPAVAPGVRDGLSKKLGEGPFKGLFALDIVFSLLLIIFGWKTETPGAVYIPPLLGSPVPTVLLALALLLLIASSLPNNLRRIIRHPQMAAVICWSCGHLLTNGDSRSVVLFGGLGAWAILEMVFISRRDGPWQKPAAVPYSRDMIMLLLAAIAIAVLVKFHLSLFGVAAVVA